MPFSFSVFFSKMGSENSNDIGNIGNGVVGTESTDIGQKSKVHVRMSGVWHSTYLTMHEEDFITSVFHHYTPHNTVI